MEQTKYDPSLFEEVKENYKAGKSYQIQKWEWDYNNVTRVSNKKILNSIVCPTLVDFERELWDLFAAFANKETVNTVWGSPNTLRDQNPHRPHEPYYDGVIFYLLRQEFIDCFNYRDVSHFMSCLVHFGYFNLDFIVT